MLGSTIRTAVYISFLGSLHVFGLIWIMSQGGPVGASETMATYMYRFGFVRFYLGYGSAVAVVLALLCMVFSLIYQRFATREEVMGSTA